MLTCKHCKKQWAPEVSDFVRSGYWPATMQAQTLFHQDLFHSFEAMKTAAPGMSVKAFTAMLDQRTKQFARVSKNVKLKDKFIIFFIISSCKAGQYGKTSVKSKQGVNSIFQAVIFQVSDMNWTKDHTRQHLTFASFLDLKRFIDKT